MAISVRKKILLLLLIAIFGTTSCMAGDNSLEVFHSPSQLNGVHEIWSLDNIYTIQDSYNSMLTAANGEVCYLGGMNKSATNQIGCNNGLNGNLLWTADSKSHTAIYATSNSVLVAYSGIPTVVKYSNSGSLIWSREFPGTGIMYLGAVGSQVQALTIPERFVVLDLESGETLEVLVGSKVYFHSKLETVVEQNGLKSINPVSGNTIWTSTIGDEILLGPTFLEDVILVRTGRIIGKIVCIDRKTGKILWESRDDIISNLAYSTTKGLIYALSRNGELLGIDKRNGKETIMAKYTTSPFILNGEKDVGGYEIALDEDIEVLFVLLGDSRQLFAFKID